MTKKICIRRMIAALLLSVVCATALAADKPMVTFTHKKHPELYNCSMKVSRLKVFGKLLPVELKREVGEDYYPEMRKGLLENGHSAFKEGTADLKYKSDGLFDVHMEFRLFYLDLTDMTWSELDRFFEKNFGFVIPD